MSAYDAEMVRRFADHLGKGVVITDKGQRDIAAQLRAASERIERLERALRKYGNHTKYCIHTRKPSCICGFDELQAALSTDQGRAGDD